MIRLNAPHLTKMITTISDILHLGIFFENGSFIGEHNIGFVKINIACIKIGTHNKGMECIVTRAVTGVISRFCKFT